MAPESSPTAEPITVLAVARGPWASACVAFLVLFAIAIDSLAKSRSQDVSDFDYSVQADHARAIREGVVPAFPYSIGDWLGEDAVPAADAVDLLRPNVLVSRIYSNVHTGETATLLFVHCGDARDLRGHFPPRCYPSQGRTLLSAVARDWTLSGAVFGGTRYRFSGKDLIGGNEVVVDNFMLLPDGTVERDMDSMNRIVEDVDLRRFGAAELQILTPAGMTDERRDEVLRTLLAESAPLFKSVGAGGKP